MKEIGFILISFFLGIICIKYIRSYDKHEKEPFIKMLAVTCWGGIWSIFISSIIYMSVRSLGIHDIENGFGALFVIGPTEELAKLLAFVSSYFIIRKEMNEPADGIIYMSCVALGFSLIENYYYAIGPGAGQLLIYRLFISTPMHICFSAFMGLSVYIWFENKKALSLVFLSFILASIGHGIYDMIIFNGFVFIVLLLVMRGLFVWTMDLLSYATALSPYRCSLHQFIISFKNPQVEEGIECLHCGSKAPKTTYSMGNMIIQKCDNCEYYVSTKKSLFHIFHHFAATFRNISNWYLSSSLINRKESILYKNNHISDDKRLAYFNLDELSVALEEVNASIVDKMEKKWWLPSGLLKSE